MTPTGAAREKFYFEYVTTPTSDTAGTTILLHFDNQRYLFGNISEGAQRACVQHGVGLRKVRNIFLSGQVGWGHIGGLIGMILTLADTHAQETEAAKLHSGRAGPLSGRQNATGNSSEKDLSSGEGTLAIHGGEKLMQTLACARRFVLRKGMPVSIKEFEFSNHPNLDEPTWKDENIRLWAMSIAPSTTNMGENETAGDSDAILGPEKSPRGKRKRSHDQLGREIGESFTPNDVEQHQSHQAIRQRIISDMFRSEWKRDALFERQLADVKMPAAMFVRDPASKKIISYAGPKPGGEEPLPDIKVLVRNPWPGALVEDLPPTRDLGFTPAMSYIVQGYPQRGRFDPAKAAALGVPAGRSRATLTSGQPITLENGSVVTPDMVLGPTKPGRGVAIVDLPSTKYVENLVGRPEWCSERQRNGLEAICWILGPGVASHPSLKRFMESMVGVEHIISSVDVCPNYLALDSSAASAIRLSRISKKHFPVPIHDNVTLPQIDTRNRLLPQEIPKFIAADRGLTIQVEPTFFITRDHVPPLLNTAEVVKNMPRVVLDRARLAHEEIAAEMGSHDDSGSEHKGDVGFDPEVITLGTGSAQPSKYRNVSATLLRTEEYGNFLFDCGENTLGQLRRVFDPPALADILRNLKFIWISHLHADHHLGTISVLNAQKQASIEEAQDMTEAEGTTTPIEPSQRVVVAAEFKMLKFLEEYGSVETIARTHPVVCKPWQEPTVKEETAKFLRQQLGIRDFQTTGVDHCSGAQAISITWENGFKFSYSGDCRPSINFAKIGKGSDVLVHEATFDDGMDGDALAKKHCTTGEALGVAASMKAKNVILTHFSQRYQKLPVMENVKMPSSAEASARTSTDDPLSLVENEFGPDTAGRNVLISSDPDCGVEKTGLLEMAKSDKSTHSIRKLNMNICVAFDYMRVRVSSIKHMQKFYPALAALFEAEQTKLVEGNAPTQAKSEIIEHGRGSKKPRPKDGSGQNGSRKRKEVKESSQSRSGASTGHTGSNENEVSKEGRDSIRRPRSERRATQV